MDCQSARFKEKGFTLDVISEMTGLSPEEIARLYKDGICSDLRMPIQAILEQLFL